MPPLVFLFRKTFWGPELNLQGPNLEEKEMMTLIGCKLDLLLSLVCIPTRRPKVMQKKRCQWEIYGYSITEYYIAKIVFKTKM